MKRIIAIITAIFLVSLTYSQNIESHKPMGKFSYKMLTKRIERPKTDKKRMKKGIRIIKRKHISSNQLYKLSLLFNEEEYRLGFVKSAYPRITDKSNAIVICDGFEKFSNQTILWEYIKKENKKYGIDGIDIASYQEYLELKDRKKDKQYDKNKDKDLDLDLNKDNKSDKEESPKKYNKESSKDGKKESDSNKTEPKKTNNKDEETNNNSNETIKEENTQSIIFPNAKTYTGTNKGCNQRLNDKQFLAFANTVARFETDKEKATICMEYAHKYCFTTTQVMKLGLLISNETSRYIFFKTAYEKVYDKDNFLHVKQLLKNDKYILGINSIYEVPKTEKPTAIDANEPTNTRENCKLSENDFNDFKSKVRKETFSTTRLEVAKVLLPKYKCISSKQVKGIIGLLVLEEDKLEFAKFAYSFTNDKQNYTIIKDLFRSQQHKDEIIEIMKK